MIPADILFILSNWDFASQSEILRVKRCLMPDDDISNLKFRVASHPYFDSYGRMYIALFDVKVFCEDIHICDIRIDCESKKPFYTFLTLDGN